MDSCNRRCTHAVPREETALPLRCELLGWGPGETAAVPRSIEPWGRPSSLRRNERSADSAEAEVEHLVVRAAQTLLEVLDGQRLVGRRRVADVDHQTAIAVEDPPVALRGQQTLVGQLVHVPTLTRLAAVEVARLLDEMSTGLLRLALHVQAHAAVSVLQQDRKSIRLNSSHDQISY